MTGDVLNGECGLVKGYRQRGNDGCLKIGVGPEAAFGVTGYTLRILY